MKRKQDSRLGVVLWEGPSRYDGTPIVVIATGFGRSKNPKTGEMISTWILPASENPVDAYRVGRDTSVCGTCMHRSVFSGGHGTCYVTVFQAPNAIWKAWKNGRYAPLTEKTLAQFKDRKVRLGSYGDPAAVPVEVWQKITAQSDGWTGYTHGWEVTPELKSLCMASCDTPADRFKAKGEGWRTFRLVVEGEKLQQGEYRCPASNEAGHKTTCDKCTACSGGACGRRKDPVIVAHGRDYKVARYVQVRASMV